MRYCLECRIGSCGVVGYFDDVDEVNRSDWQEITKVSEPIGQNGNTIYFHVGYCPGHAI